MSASTGLTYRKEVNYTISYTTPDENWASTMESGRRTLRVEGRLDLILRI